jgi:hypothetical protein
MVLGTSCVAAWEFWRKYDNAFEGSMVLFHVMLESMCVRRMYAARFLPPVPSQRKPQQP